MNVVKTIFNLVGYEVAINNQGERKGDVASLVASAQKIKKELGWEAKVDLENGLKKTIDFFRSLPSSI